MFLVEEVLLGPDDGDVVPQLTVVVLRMEIHLEVEDVKNTHGRMESEIDLKFETYAEAASKLFLDRGLNRMIVIPNIIRILIEVS